jgi:hypothetical protein
MVMGEPKLGSGVPDMFDLHRARRLVPANAGPYHLPAVRQIEHRPMVQVSESLGPTAAVVAADAPCPMLIVVMDHDINCRDRTLENPEVERRRPTGRALTRA